MGVMPRSPQGSSRVLGNSGRVLSAWYQSLSSISCGPRTLCASLSCGIMMGSVMGRHHFDSADFFDMDGFRVLMSTLKGATFLETCLSKLSYLNILWKEMEELKVLNLLR
ncbi:unnamed protein product [Prunus armeniaca]